MMLSDLINAVSRIWTPPPRHHGKDRMTIPSLQDIRNCQQSVKVAVHCQECARLLSVHLYSWEKRFPERSTVKIWSVESGCFLGMDINDFQNYLMSHFSLRTEDGREWLLDRSIAALIWNACIDEASPLPAASWQIEIDRKRMAARVKEK